MKKLFLLLLILTFQNSFSSELTLPEKADRGSLSIRLANYATHSPEKLLYTILSDLQKFGTLDLTEKQDLPLVRNALSTLILIDKIDIPRSGALSLSDSYGRHKPLFQKAATLIETAKNKKLLQELIKIMSDFFEHGNG